MKLTVTSDVLASTLALVGQAVAKRGSLPVLYCVVLEHKDGELLVAATNLEQTIHRYLTTNTSGDGAVLVPFKEFIAYMKLVPKGVNVELERDMRDALTVRFGGSTATFRGQCAADYPRLPGIFDPGPYEAIREIEKIERARLAQAEEDRKEAEKQAEQQQDELADRIERVRSFVAQSAVKAQRGPRVTKQRFAYKADTIERFFQRAIKVGATVKVSNLAKHEGNLIEYTPLYINQESFVVRFEQGEPFPIHKSNVRYLESCC